jgi:hypothetical protein
MALSNQPGSVFHPPARPPENLLTASDIVDTQ